MNYHHVAFCCAGEKGLKDLAVALLSLFDSHSDPEKLRVHLVWESLSENALESLRLSWRSHEDQIVYYRAFDYLGERALEPKAGYWFRTWLGDILPAEFERVLYLDTDVLVLKDISPLWEIDLARFALGAVADPNSRTFGLAKAAALIAKKVGLPYDSDDAYFNSGVLLINLARWRELDVGVSLHRLFGKFRDSYRHFHDQDELNIFFKDNLCQLSPSWNLMESIDSYGNWPYDLYRGLGAPADYFAPHIRHFAGQEKAGGVWRRCSSKRLFYGYLDRTPWAGGRSHHDGSWWGGQFAQLLDLHYLVERGAKQRSLPGYSRRLVSLVLSNPLLLFGYALIPLYRIFLRLRSYLRQASSKP